MNCIIVDDEPLARNEMHALLEELTDFNVIGKFSNALKAMEFLKINQVDVVFLDIEMPFLNGLDFAELIPAKTLLIFTTAYPQYAHKSYELDAIDYLLKPIDKLRLLKATKKATLYKKMLNAHDAQTSLEEFKEEFLWINSDRRHYKVNYSEILFVEGLKDYVIIHTQNQKFVTAMNLKTIHQKLVSLVFLRVSKSYIVNRTWIESFNSQTIYIKDFEIPLGEVYRKDFLNSYDKKEEDL